MSNEALKAFLYDLMRDHLPVGVVWRLVQDNEGVYPPVKYTNEALASIAEDLAKRLSKGPPATSG